MDVTGLNKALRQVALMRVREGLAVARRTRLKHEENERELRRLKSVMRFPLEFWGGFKTI